MPKLTDKKVKALKKPGRYGDGEGLYLEVAASGSKSWILRVTAQGRRRDIGLGGYPDAPLSEAREKARDLRRIAKAGGDPLAAKRPVQPSLTFEEAARIVYDHLKPGWREGGVHVKHWITSLENHVFPAIGAKPVSDVTGQDVLAVLQPIWFSTPETARRIRQRIRAVMAWAKSTGNYDGENPVETANGALPRNTDAEPRHHPALPYDDVPAVMRRLEAQSGASGLALRFIILTAVRSIEARGARWEEIDLDAATWTIPASRMKNKRGHRVPLSKPALDVLSEARGLSPDLVFPSPRSVKPLTDVAVSKALRRATDAECVVHGFRSTFRDWAWEKTDTPREIAELCLAHQVGNAVERAYARSDLFEKRRALIESWADHVSQSDKPRATSDI